MKPDFLVIGAQKCATSSLCDLLGRHPDVYVTSPKEPYFFSHDEVWDRGWPWYEQLFADGAECRRRGEGSTSYSMADLYPNAAPRIFEHLDDPRLIYIVRNPLQRIESHYLHLLTRGGRETHDFDQALRRRPEYVDNTLYLKQTEIYRRHYGEDRLLVLFLEDFRVDPEPLLRRCFELLDVDPDAPLEAGHEPLNTARRGRADRPLLKPLRRIPFFEQVRRAAPSGLRDSLVRLLKRPARAGPVWTDETRRWVLDRIAEDNRAFLERYGKPADYWF